MTECASAESSGSESEAGECWCGASLADAAYDAVAVVYYVTVVGRDAGGSSAYDATDAVVSGSGSPSSRSVKVTVELVYDEVGSECEGSASLDVWCGAVAYVYVVAGAGCGAAGAESASLEVVVKDVGSFG